METPKPKMPSQNTLSFRPPQIQNARLHSVSIDNDGVGKIERFNESAAMAGEAVKNFNDCFEAAPEKLDFKTFKKPEAKKPFELKPHLTQRPFLDERLMQLKETLPRHSTKNAN